MRSALPPILALVLGACGHAPPPGWFAHDRGCGYDTAIYECKLVDSGSAERAMAAAGWNQADPTGRQELLVAFMAEIVKIKLVTSDSRGDFPKYDHTFEPPTGPPSSTGSPTPAA